MISNKLLSQLEKILALMPPLWDCRKAVLEMRDSGYPHWKQMEWIGFYFQFLCDNKLALLGKIPGPKYGNSDFDGLFEIPWDFKVHPTKNTKGKETHETILNDKQAMLDAVKEYMNVGVILAIGNVEYNDKDRSFQAWHKELKGGLSKYEKDRLLREAPSRLRKTSFRLIEIDLFLLNEKIIRNLKLFQEGFRNSDGSPRRPKVLLDLTSVKPVKVIKF